tara:strand:+ start:5674 stop:6378 length:705 start_codon:yes stop_codon:yes gene_type:complete
MSFIKLSIANSVFKLRGSSSKGVTELDVVLINAAKNYSRVYYTSTYDSNNPRSPDCWSSNNVKPDMLSREVQSDTCSTCEKNIAGSGVGATRACRFYQYVALLLANDLGGAVIQLAVPGSSIFGKTDGGSYSMKSYAKYLVQENIDPEMLVTKMSFDSTSMAAKILFKPARWLTAEEQALVLNRGKSDAAIRAIKMSFAPASVSNIDAANLKLTDKNFAVLSQAMGMTADIKFN